MTPMGIVLQKTCAPFPLKGPSVGSPSLLLDLRSYQESLTLTDRAQFLLLPAPPRTLSFPTELQVSFVHVGCEVGLDV